jgi:NAD(P)-dependent dehydrogenase (short-subunit alcohol dehydrogenase family)
VALQHGKVFIVTGGASGIGLELVKVLYQKGGRVYIAGRSEDKARQAMRDIQTAAPPSNSHGSLEFLQLDLADLASIKASADAFKAKESRLDVLWNNAGVSQPPLGSVSNRASNYSSRPTAWAPFCSPSSSCPSWNPPQQPTRLPPPAPSASSGPAAR